LRWQLRSPPGFARAPSVRELIDELGSRSPEVRLAAAFAAGEVREASAVPALLALKTSGDPERQVAVFVALGQQLAHGAQRRYDAMSRLVEGLGDASPLVRAHAALAIGEMLC